MIVVVMEVVTMLTIVMVTLVSLSLQFVHSSNTFAILQLINLKQLTMQCFHCSNLLTFVSFYHLWSSHQLCHDNSLLSLWWLFDDYLEYFTKRPLSQFLQESYSFGVDFPFICGGSVCFLWYIRVSVVFDTRGKLCCKNYYNVLYSFSIS